MAVKFKKNHTNNLQRKVISTSSKNDLPDSAFAYVEPGEKDENGRTTPRSKRHLPYKHADGSIDLPHLRNALARLDQTDIPPDAKAKARSKLEAAARQAGVGDYGNSPSQGERMATPTTAGYEPDPEELLQQIQMLLADTAAAAGLEADVQFRAKKAAPPSDDEDEDEEDDSDEEDGDDEDEDDEEEAPPPPTKKAKRADVPAPALTRATVVKAFTTPNLAELAYIPITRRDDAKREIEGVLSNEELDTFGTVFDYDSMKRAVNERWHGNVREQHDPKKAVGKGVYVACDDDKRQVVVRARISTGAEDTWQKILDGVLCGFSIGAANAKTETRMVGEKAVPCYKDFDLAEISVVDAPSNPGAARSGLTIYRSATAVQGQEDVYADFLAADEAEASATDTPAATTPAEAVPTVPPERAQQTEAPVTPPAPPAAVAQPDPILTRADLGDTMSGQPTLTSGPDIDHEAINGAMNGDTGYTHVHAHPYDESTSHMNDHMHEHTDGTAHKHPHSHGHVGSGDGSRPHVHLHEHGHQYRVAASDLQRTQAGSWRVPESAFVGQDDARLAQYLPKQERAEAPAALPASSVETSGKPVINVTLATNTDPKHLAQAIRAEMGSRVTTPDGERRHNAVLAGAQVPDETRRGARVSGATRSGLHDTIKNLCQTCTGDDGECPHCNAVLAVLDPDHDGDDDLDANLDDDHDMAGRVQKARLTRAVQSIVAEQIHRELQPILTQQRQITARLAGVQVPEINRFQAQLDEVCAVLTAVQGQVQKVGDLTQRIAEQEQPGAPMVRAVEKSLPGQTSSTGAEWTQQDVATLRKAGLRGLTTPQEQTQLAASIIAQQAGLR